MIKRILHYLICAITCFISLNMYSQCTPGTMVNQTYFACDGQTAVAATLMNPVLGPGCIAAYAILDPNGATIACDADGTFTFSDYSFVVNTAYNIHSIVGMDTDGDGCPDANTTISSSSSQIYFFEPITYSTQSTCVNGTLEHCVTLDGGGYPACFPNENATFTVTTNIDHATLSNPASVQLGQTICYTSTMDMDLTGSIADNTGGCTAEPFTTSNSTPCVCEAGNLTVNEPTGCVPLGNSVIFDASVTGDSADEITYYVHTQPTGGTFFPTLTTNDGNFDCSGCIAPCTPFYVSAVAGTPDASGYVSFTDNCDIETSGPFTYESAPSSTPVISSTSDLNICIGSGQTVDVTSNVTGGSWVITNSAGMILGTPPSGMGLNFDGTQPGNCNIYYVSDGCSATNLATGDNISSISTCSTLSNAITVIRTNFGDVPAMMPNATILTCNGDGIVSATGFGGVGTQTYILTNAAAPNFGDILASNATGLFDLSQYISAGDVAYVSATVGNMNSGSCFAVSNESTPVTFYDEIEISTNIDCVNGEQNLSLSMIGGSPANNPNDTYAVTVFSGDVLGAGGSSGMILANATAVPYGSTFTLVDANGNPIDLVCNEEYTVVATCCNNLCTDTVSITAPCLDMVGTMPTSNIISCDDYNGSTIVATNVVVNSGMGVQTYILHAGDPTMPIATNTTGQFDLQGLGIAPGVFFEISAAANYNSDCVEYSTNSQQVVYYPPITVDVTTYCNANGGISADLVVTGGAPSINPSIEYNVSFGGLSGQYPANTVDGLVLTDVTITPGQTVTALVNCCNTACEGTDTDIAPNVFYNGSLCTDDFHVVSGPGWDNMINCEATGTGNGGVLNYYLAEPGSGSSLVNIAGPQPTGDFSMLALPTCSEYQIYAIYGVDNDNDGVVDDNNEDCNVMLDGPSIFYYSPIQVFPLVTCASPGNYQVEYTVTGGTPMCDSLGCANGTNTYTITNGTGQTIQACPGETYVLNYNTGTEFPLGSSNFQICVEDQQGFNTCFISPMITSCAPLPIELVSYTGSVESEGNLLSWVTGTELNSDFFTILKSNDGIEFTEIGTVAAAGISTSEKEYSLLDNDFNNLTGTKYYKLVQADIDGRTEEVGIVQLTRDKDVTVFNNKLDILELSPVPAVDLLSVTIEANEGVTDVAIYDMSGRITYSNSIEATNGENSFDVVVSDFATGAYVISITNKNETVSERFIKD